MCTRFFFFVRSLVSSLTRAVNFFGNGSLAKFCVANALIEPLFGLAGF